MSNSLFVIKADKTKEPYSTQKLRSSIERAGVPPALRDQAMEHIESIMYDGIHTSEIYRHMREYLGTSSQPYAKTKYSLKQSIMDLGPSGYPFEDYVAHLLTMQGYTTKTRQVVQGTCVRHEIDIIATSHDAKIVLMVEAKFHNANGMRTNVHVPLYTYARFLDAKTTNGFTHPMVITNTKISLDGIAYGTCVEMEIVSWNYPEGKSLRELVERYQLYPITALSRLSARHKQLLLEQGVLLCSQICSDNSLLDAAGLDQEQKQHVIDEASFVCSLR